MPDPRVTHLVLSHSAIVNQPPTNKWRFATVTHETKPFRPPRGDQAPRSSSATEGQPVTPHSLPAATSAPFHETNASISPGSGVPVSGSHWDPFHAAIPGAVTPPIEVNSPA